MPTTFYGRKPDTEYNNKVIHGYPKVGYLSEVTGTVDDIEHPEEEDTNSFDPSFFKTDELIIQEKLDGGNFRVHIDSDITPIYGSRKNIFGTDITELNGFFRRPASYINNTLSEHSMREVSSKYGPITIFGENMLYHSIDYDWDTVEPWVVFDMWSHDEKRFLHFDTVTEISHTLGFETVELVDRVSPNEFELDDYNDLQSNYGEGLIAEGIVIKDYESQSFAKYVNEDFREVHTNRWGNTQRDAETGEGLRAVDYTEYLNAKYITNNRIEKHVRKLVMERDELSMKLTGDLIDAVYYDIWEEHMYTIIDSGETVDMSQLRKGVSNRCRERLKAIVRNREMIEDMDEEITDAKYLDLMAIGMD